MKLSEELVWRGFAAETTVGDPAELDTRESKKFYLGADPSADSLTIGNLAAIMMCACFVRHGYEPYLLVGGATGQIGDPKDTGERELKSLEEVEHNKRGIGGQMRRILEGVAGGGFRGAEGYATGARGSRGEASGAAKLTMVDNYDWFKDIKYLEFLREVGKAFSMTQLLDRQFVQARIGEGGSGISYAEFSYTLIQGYDFLHLYRKYGIDLQLCGADQFGNCASGIHLIRRLEGAGADVWSTPLIIDPVSGRKFGKSEGNAVWLDAKKTSVFDFYQFWLGQADSAAEYLLKIYTMLGKEEIEGLMREQEENPAGRAAQKALARGATEVVHGRQAAEAVEALTERLFGGELTELAEDEIREMGEYLAQAKRGMGLFEALVETGLCASKGEARKLAGAGAISVNGVKVGEDVAVEQVAILKRGKNKFGVVI